MTFIETGEKFPTAYIQHRSTSIAKTFPGAVPKASELQLAKKSFMSNVDFWRKACFVAMRLSKESFWSFLPSLNLQSLYFFTGPWKSGWYTLVNQFSRNFGQQSFLNKTLWFLCMCQGGFECSHDIYLIATRPDLTRLQKSWRGMKKKFCWSLTLFVSQNSALNFV